MIQLQDLDLHLHLLEEVLDLGAEGAGGLGEDHDPVGGHHLVHNLHGGGGDGGHGGQAAELRVRVQKMRTAHRTIWKKTSCQALGGLGSDLSRLLCTLVLSGWTRNIS